MTRPNVVDRALASGASEPLEYIGAGMTGVVFCHGDLSYKVARRIDPTLRSIFEDEAEFFHAAGKVSGVAEHVAQLVRFDPERLVITKLCIEADADRRAREIDLWDLHYRIQARMIPYGWTAPEFKPDSYVNTAARGPVLVDGSMAHRVGQVLVEFVVDVLDGRRQAWRDLPRDMAFSLRMEVGKTLTAEQVEPLLARLSVLDPQITSDYLDGFGDRA